MVAQNRLLLTGAGGFLGKAIRAEARARGLSLRATARSANSPDLIAADLAADPVEGLLDGVDTVIHAAGRMTGSDAEHERDTLAPTRRLVAAMGGRRLLLISSLSVLGYGALRPGSRVDEDTELEARPGGRDAYARAKLAQEGLVPKGQCLILRPGAIYGSGRLWNGHLGVAKGPVLFRIGGDGDVPLIHAQSAARAILDAAVSGETGVLHLVDDNLPSRADYAAWLAAGGWPKITVPVPWPVARGASRVLRGPGLLRPETLAARIMPLRYANARAKAALPWVPETDHAARIRDAQHAEAA